jgi:hypothetical protein
MLWWPVRWRWLASTHLRRRRGGESASKAVTREARWFTFAAAAALDNDADGLAGEARGLPARRLTDRTAPVVMSASVSQPLRLLRARQDRDRRGERRTVRGLLSVLSGGR